MSKTSQSTCDVCKQVSRYGEIVLKGPVWDRHEGFIPRPDMFVRTIDYCGKGCALKALRSIAIEIELAIQAVRENWTTGGPDGSYSGVGGIGCKDGGLHNWDGRKCSKCGISMPPFVEEGGPGR